MCIGGSAEMPPNMQRRSGNESLEMTHDLRDSLQTWAMTHFLAWWQTT